MFNLSQEPPIIISVGGSLIVPNGNIDHEFLSRLNIFIRENVKKGKRFFLVAGGGMTARHYRDAGKAVVGTMNSEDLDWLGIHATRLNAHLLRTIFQDIAHPRIIENYDKKLSNWKEPVVIGSGWKPGWSTDYDAVVLARDYGASLIINLSNIDWVYDKDPRTNKDAKIIKKITWEEIEKIIGNTWTPGLNAPFDPIAAQLAKKLGLTAIVANGIDFANLNMIVNGEAFKGTVIMPYRIDASFYDREYYAGKKGEYRLGHVESVWGTVYHRIKHLYRAFLIKVLLNPKTCLDVGCGTGGLVWALRMMGIDAHGVEISEDALHLAEDDVKPYLQVGDITHLPFEESSYDLVLSYDVLEHVEGAQIKKAVQETIRVSRRFILHKIYTRENVWITYFHKRDFSHVSVHTKRFWQRLFNENPQIALVRSSFIRLPTFFESVFLLRKK